MQWHNGLQLHSSAEISLMNIIYNWRMLYTHGQLCYKIWSVTLLTLMLPIIETLIQTLTTNLTLTLVVYRVGSHIIITYSAVGYQRGTGETPATKGLSPLPRPKPMLRSKTIPVTLHSLLHPPMLCRNIIFPGVILPRTPNVGESYGSIHPCLGQSPLTCIFLATGLITYAICVNNCIILIFCFCLQCHLF